MFYQVCCCFFYSTIAQVFVYFKYAKSNRDIYGHILDAYFHFMDKKQC